jgi:hypothetical protein
MIVPCQQYEDVVFSVVEHLLVFQGRCVAVLVSVGESLVRVTISPSLKRWKGSDLLFLRLKVTMVSLRRAPSDFAGNECYCQKRQTSKVEQ